MKHSVAILLLVISVVSIAFAADFWISKPFTKWSDAEVERMRTDSPWAKTTILRTGTITGRGGIQAVNDSQIEPRITYAVSIRSAMPIREANVRLRQLRERYEKMDATAKQAFDAKWNTYLETKFSDTMVVAVLFESNVPGVDQQLTAFFQRQTLDDVKQSAALVLPDGTRVAPIAFVAGPHEMQFGFPRPTNLAPGQSFSVEFTHPDMPDQPSRRISQRFAVKDMMFNGAPTY